MPQPHSKLSTNGRIFLGSPEAELRLRQSAPFDPLARRLKVYVAGCCSKDIKKKNKNKTDKLWMYLTTLLGMIYNNNIPYERC